MTPNPQAVYPTRRAVIEAIAEDVEPRMRVGVRCRIEQLIFEALDNNPVLGAAADKYDYRLLVRSARCYIYKQQELARRKGAWL